MIARPALALFLVAGLAHAQTTFSVMVNGMTFQVDRYTPAGAGPFPVVALGHGFSNSKDNVRGLAHALQADGVVVVAPQLTGGLGINHSLNGDALVAAVDATVQAGIGDGTRIAFGGHSAGGLAAWLAASRRAQTRALVLLDPVDNNTLGAAQTANVMAPTLFAFAPPQACNTQNNSVAWFTGKTGLKGRFNVPMANHCDPQEPSNTLCLAGCGPSFITPAIWNATRSAVYKRYARAFFGQFLLGNGSCVESMAVTDATSGTINQVTMSLGGCGADGGMGGGAAGGGAAGGGAAAGGAAAGGAAAGGAAAGGAAAGGAAAGGAAAGGAAAGGAAAGGAAAGGAAAGGSAAGGSAAGGTATGTCGPLNCNGCCNGLVCVQSTDQTCGMNGGACAVCSSVQMCEAGRCTSTPQPGCGCNSTSELGALALIMLLGLTLRRR
jgi:MYXO-CTERM domain-containing protein